MNIDTIIIGSGAGGLSCALSLAKSGQRVLLLEQHSVAGGWCHSFNIKGKSFSPGLHYIGLLGEKESSSELYKGLGIAEDLLFFRMNPKAHEHCWIGEERFDIPATPEAFAEALITRFPHEKKGILRYLKTVSDVSRELQLIPKMRGFWDAITIPWRTRHLGKYGLFSLKRVIDWHVSDPLLKRILNVQCGDHGLPPARASFVLHAAVMQHYFQGGYYPMGGGASIVKAFLKAIKAHGSEVRTKQSVKNILIEGDLQKRAIGVELQSGEKIYAKHVISNADPSKTYLELVGSTHLSQKLKEKLQKTEYSCSSLILFVTVEKDVAGLDSGNIWVMPNEDMDEVYEQMMHKDIASGEVFQGLFISCTTLKDPTSFDGKHHVLEVLTFVNYDAFAAFKERPSEYKDFKNLLTQKMLRTLEKNLPTCKGKIVHYELGTPLTNEHFINATKGSVYGTQKSLNQIGPNSFRAKSEIEGLYLCGASVLSHGVAGASFSGVQTAAEVLNSTQEALLFHDGTQVLQIYDAQDSTHYPEWLHAKIEMKKEAQKNL